MRSWNSEKSQTKLKKGERKIVPVISQPKKQWSRESGWNDKWNYREEKTSKELH